jgi:hypothetical protein
VENRPKSTRSRQLGQSPPADGAGAHATPGLPNQAIEKSFSTAC